MVKGLGTKYFTYSSFYIRIFYIKNVEAEFGEGSRICERGGIIRSHYSLVKRLALAPSQATTILSTC